MYAAEYRSTWVDTGWKQTSVFLDQWPLISVREFVNKMDVCVIFIREQFFFLSSLTKRSVISSHKRPRTEQNNLSLTKNKQKFSAATGGCLSQSKRMFTASAPVLCSVGMGGNYIEVERIST
jgi:hypothetical protein